MATAPTRQRNPVQLQLWKRADARTSERFCVIYLLTTQSNHTSGWRTHTHTNVLSHVIFTCNRTRFVISLNATLQQIQSGEHLFFLFPFCGFIFLTHTVLSHTTVVGPQKMSKSHKMRSTLTPTDTPLQTDSQLCLLRILGGGGGFRL